MTVTHCTDNSDLFFDQPAEHLLGKNYNAIFPVEIFHTINNLIGSSFLKKRRITLQEWDVGDRRFHLTLAQTSDHISIEIEWLNYEEKSLGFWIRELEIIRSTLDRIDQTQKIIDRVVIGLRRVLGFERVLFLKADKEKGYTLMSEAVGPFLSSAKTLPLSLNRPASKTNFNGPKACFDFDKRQAKLLTSCNPKQIALSLKDKKLSVLPTSLSYSYSLLDHDALVDNSVASFIAFPLFINDELWGVFECHHMTPHIAGRNMREALTLFSEFLSYQLTLIEMTSRLEMFERQINHLN